MRTERFIHFILGLALAAIPASATIDYSSCNSGCGATNGTYAAMPTETGASGLTFSSQLTFGSGGLSGSTAIYTDSTTGVVFLGYNGTTQDSLTTSGTTLAQTNSGSGYSIELTLPANTYAVAMMIGASSFADPWVELVSSPSDLNTTTNAQYMMVIPNSSSPQFFGIVADPSGSPLTNIFVWNSGTGGTLNIQSFEIGTESGGGNQSGTPEPSTLLLMGGGFAGLYFMRRRRAA